MEKHAGPGPDDEEGNENLLMENDCEEREDHDDNCADVKRNSFIEFHRFLGDSGKLEEHQAGEHR